MEGAIDKIKECKTKSKVIVSDSCQLSLECLWPCIQYHTRQRIIVFIYQFNYSGYKYVQKELTVIHFLYLFNNGNKKMGEK